LFLIKLLAGLPMSVLYVVSDIISFLNFYLIACRKDVIMKNLTMSFPGMSDKENAKVLYGFNRNLSDVMVETIKAFRISRDDLTQRMTFSNIEALDVCKR